MSRPRWFEAYRRSLIEQLESLTYGDMQETLEQLRDIRHDVEDFEDKVDSEL